MTSVGTSPILKIEELGIDFVTYSGISHVIEKVNIEVNPGEIVGLVGESGCGKTAIAILCEVNIGDPERVLKSYPFELSGGMKQRVLIAMALAAQPSLIVADEPGTSLDVSVQDQVLDLIVDLVKRKNVSVLFIT